MQSKISLLRVLIEESLYNSTSQFAVLIMLKYVHNKEAKLDGKSVNTQPEKEL